MKRRILSGILLAAMLIACAVSCSDSKTPNNAETTAADTQDTETTAAETTVVNYKSANLPETKLDGYNFRIISQKTENVWWQLDTEEQTGEVFNDAIYERNNTIEEAFDVKITPVFSDSASAFQTNVKTAVSAGDDIFDVAFGPFNYTNPMALENMLIDLHTLDHFDFDAQWWDANFVDSFTLGGGNMYYAAGSISPIVDLRSYVMVFHKDLADSIGYEYPYEAVLDGKWTREYFSKYIKGVNADLNGVGELCLDLLPHGRHGRCCGDEPILDPSVTNSAGVGRSPHIDSCVRAVRAVT